MKHWLGDFAVDHTGHPAPLKKKQSVLVFDPRLVVARNLLSTGRTPPALSLQGGWSLSHCGFDATRAGL